MLGWLFIAGEVTGPPPGTARGLRVSPPATRSNKTNNRPSHFSTVFSGKKEDIVREFPQNTKLHF